MSIYDIEHIAFLKKKKFEKRQIVFFRFLILFLFLILWELFSRLGFINTFLFSCPTNILKTLFNLLKNGELFKHLIITIYEIIVSFSMCACISFIIAFVLWKYPIISKIVEPYLTVLNSLPKVALGPLIIIWVGASIKSIIFMSLLISVFVTIINIYNSFINTDQNYITLMKSLKASDWSCFRKVILPSNLNNIISAMKVNISMSLIGVIMGELLVSKAGIGYLIMYGSQVFNIDLVITGVFILGILSYFMYYIVDKLQLIFNKKET